MLCCLSWLCSTWNSIRNWIGDNKFLTVVHVVAVVLLVFGATMVCWYWEWFVMGTEGRETGSTTARNLGLGWPAASLRYGSPFGAAFWPIAKRRLLRTKCGLPTTKRRPPYTKPKHRNAVY